MKRFLTTIPLFILFCFVFYLYALFVWGKYAPSSFKPNLKYKIGSNGFLFTRLKEIKGLKYNNVDVLFLGSSHTYRGFDPRIFKEYGFKTFNLGSNAQSPIQTQVLLKRYLNQLNPKLIIFEVYPEKFTADGVESSLDIIANDKNDYYSWAMALKLNHLKTYNTLLYGTIRDLLHLNKSFVEPIKKGNDTYIPGGYIEKKIAYYSPQPLPVTKIEFNKNQLVAFKDCLSLISKKGIPVMLVYAPIGPLNYKRYSNNQEFDSVMSQYGDYYNFNKILTLNDSLDFYDSHHLNQNGVNQFDKKLNQILLERMNKTSKQIAQ